jgi:hypothetical protein
MTEKNPHENPDDELLSALVDGELTPAERAAVERRLRDDPQAQELVDQLRAVSQTLQSLPKQELGADLREVVLRQAVVRAEQVPTSVGGARRWVWAALALAAALLLTVYMPETVQDGKQVAQAPANETLSDSAPPSSVSIEFSGSGSDLRAEADQIAESDHAAFGATFEGTLQQAPIELPYLQPIGEVIAEDYHIHLTPVDRSIGVAQFDQLLARHGIAVRGQADIGDKQKARRAGESLVNEPELVLVEASLEQIRQVVAACGEDGSRWKLPRLVDQGGADSGWLFVDRKKPKADSVAEEGVAADLDDLQPGDAPARGWAKHLGRNLVGADETFSNASTSSHDKMAPTLRVLFVLHPAAE